MPCNCQPDTLCCPASDTRGQIVAARVCVKDLDLVGLHKAGDPPGAESPERIAHRDVHETLGRDEIKPGLPLVRRPQCGVYLMTARRQFAAKVDKVALTAAEGLCRCYLKYTHRKKCITKPRKKRHAPQNAKRA